MNTSRKTTLLHNYTYLLCLCELNNVDVIDVMNAVTSKKLV